MQIGSSVKIDLIASSATCSASSTGTTLNEQRNSKSKFQMIGKYSILLRFDASEQGSSHEVRTYDGSFNATMTFDL